MTENGLQDRMRELCRKQRVCLNIQKLLIVLSAAFYQYAVILLPVHATVLIICGGSLANQASLLAREKYPYVLLRVGCAGKGAGRDPYIMEEARRSNDGLTVKMLKFNHWTVYCFLAAMLGNILMWCLSAAFKGL